jgi:hypothetical protein
MVVSITGGIIKSILFSEVNGDAINPSENKDMFRLYVDKDKRNVYYYPPNHRAPFMIAQVYHEEHRVSKHEVVSRWVIDGWEALHKTPEYIKVAIGRLIKGSLGLTEINIKQVKE